MGQFRTRKDLTGRLPDSKLNVLYPIEGTLPLQWMCECDCGKTRTFTANSLQSGRTKTCGCGVKGSEHLNWKGHGEISGRYFTSLKWGAKNRDFAFDVTIEEIWQLFLDQDGLCILSGLPIKFSRDTQSATASLDRKDPNVGYVTGNVQWVHKDINRMKMDLTDTRFIELCSHVCGHSKVKS